MTARRGPGYRPVEDDLIRDACGPSRPERIRDVARELGRSETAIRRRWQRLTHGGAGTVGARFGPDIQPRRADDPWNRILESAIAGCGARLTLADCERLAADSDFRRRAVEARCAALGIEGGES